MTVTTNIVEFSNNVINNRDNISESSFSHSMNTRENDSIEQECISYSSELRYDSEYGPEKNEIGATNFCFPCDTHGRKKAPINSHIGFVYFSYPKMLNGHSVNYENYMKNPCSNCIRVPWKTKYENSFAIRCLGHP